ncbi:MAG: hypothetical protein E7773_05060 [Sphingomonas sp.]|uniref:hypothetical protein n=1 Tax=Sphingomonas sp. TaxID=28214 RepID=UPI00121431BD|nr:hypothetical protein [Sphingomonas sp.]THD37393.1 MAG: hypothetical protein E7773_05060 [Sphingomonas sp.]
MGLIAAEPGADGRLADFRVGGVSFTLPMPDGYCLPVGAQADVAQVVAAADTENVTDLTLTRCGAPIVKGANDVTIIKTPRKALMVPVTRAELLTQIGKEFDNPVTIANATGDKALGQASKSLTDTFGAKVALSGTFGPRGKDEMCGYMAGVMHVESPLATYDQALAACLTSVGGRMLFIYRSGLKNDDASILQLMRETRAIAQSIKTTGGA